MGDRTACDVAAAIEECHDAAVADALKCSENHAAFTRSGTNGVAQVDTTGLIGAAFTHRDSRAGDPDLHTHVAISNKVATIDANGVMRWLALDGQPVHRFTVAASELYNTRLEAHLGQRLVAAVRRRADAEGRNKRPVREIVGISTELMTAWSSRRRGHRITASAELAKQFHATHGREPTHVESMALSQQATLETREAKHEPRSLAEQRHTWRTQAVEVLGGQRALTAMLGDVPIHPATQQLEATDDDWIAAQAAAVIATVAQPRAPGAPPRARRSPASRARQPTTPPTPTLADRIIDAALAEPLSSPCTSDADTEKGEPARAAPPRRRQRLHPPRHHHLHQRAKSWPPNGASWPPPPSARRAHRRRHRHRFGPGRNSAAPRHRHSTTAKSPWCATWPAAVPACRSRWPRPAPENHRHGRAVARLAHHRAAPSSGWPPPPRAAEVLGEDLGAPTDTIAKLVQLADTHAATPAPAPMTPPEHGSTASTFGHPAHRRRSRQGLHRWISTR